MLSNLKSEIRISPGEVEEIDRQLGWLLASPHFSRSTRYPALLQFLVQQALKGNASTLKERLIGIEVFHRPPDYDTNADPVVRVTAGEVRKRLAQYYQELEHSAELRIELPIGSYIPRFVPGHVAFFGGNSASFAETQDTGHAGHANQTVRPNHPEEEHLSVVSTVAAGQESAVARGEPAQDRQLSLIGAALPASDLGARETVPSDFVGRETRDSSFTFSRRRVHLLLTLSLLIGVVLATGGLAIHAWRDEARSRALHQLWAPMGNQGSVLFVVGDHSLDDNGHPMGMEPVVANEGETVLTRMNRRSQVPFDDMVSLEKIHAFLTRDGRTYRDKGAGEATLADLRDGPVVLFAGFDNRWSVQLSQQLPFRFAPDLEHSVGSIVDGKTASRHWTVNFAEPMNQVASDYGIVARYYDPMLEHKVFLIAGIGSMGTAAASEFVTEERFSEEIMKAAPAGWNNGNFEVVLGAPVVEGQAGPPRIIASTYW